MKKLIVIVFLGFCSTTYGQSFSNYLSRFELNGGGEIIVLKERTFFNGKETPGNSRTETAKTFTLGIAWNFPVYEISPDFSAGISPSLTALAGPSLAIDKDFNGIIESDEEGFSLMSINFPLTATIKCGRESSLDHANRFGAGIGLGYQPSWLFGSTFTYGMPIATAELSYGKNRIYKLKGSAALLPYTLNETISVAQYNISIGVIGL